VATLSTFASRHSAPGSARGEMGVRKKRIIRLHHVCLLGRDTWMRGEGTTGGHGSSRPRAPRPGRPAGVTAPLFFFFFYPLSFLVPFTVLSRPGGPPCPSLPGEESEGGPRCCRPRTPPRESERETGPARRKKDERDMAAVIGPP
jgi:hypothetical protein